MFVLGKAEDERKRAEAGAEVVKVEGGDFTFALAEITARDGNAKTDHFIGETKLAVKLESAGLNGHGAGGLAGAVVLFDDAKGSAGFGEPGGEDQAGGSGAGDEDFGLPFGRVDCDLIHVRRIPTRNIPCLGAFLHQNSWRIPVSGPKSLFWRVFAAVMLYSMRMQVDFRLHIAIAFRGSNLSQLGSKDAGTTRSDIEGARSNDREASLTEASVLSRVDQRDAVARGVTSLCRAVLPARAGISGEPEKSGVENEWEAAWSGDGESGGRAG